MFWIQRIMSTRRHSTFNTIGRTVSRTTTVLATAAFATSLCGVESFGTMVPLLQQSSSRAYFRKSRRFSSIMTDQEQEMTDDALAMIQQAIHAVDPATAIRTHLNAKQGELHASSLVYNAKDYDNVLLVAFGKASSAMAKATAERVQQAMPSVQMSGIVIVKDDHATTEEAEFFRSCNVDIYEASHPIPDARSVETAEKVMDSVAALASKRNLVICCISGGGSALFCHPKQKLLSLEDLQKVNSCLLGCGMTIQEINIIRKRLEDGKGGWLAARAYPSTVLALVLSDIIGDPLDLIASGPTVPDSSTWKDAWALIQKYNLDKEGEEFCLPSNVLNVLKMGLDGQLDDTPTSDHPVFATDGQCETILVGNNELAVLAAAKEARQRGYNPVVLGTQIEGEAKEAAGMYVAMAQYLTQQSSPSEKSYAMTALPAAVIGGGETTVTLSGSNTRVGKGGRNQELALAAALGLKKLNLRNVVLASAGTDGTDGPTDAAGAVVDGGTVDRIESRSLSVEEALQNHDAYSYFQTKDNNGHSPLIMTGPTGTNVADVCVTLIK